MAEDREDSISDIVNDRNQQQLESSLEVEDNSNSIDDSLDTSDSSPRQIFKRLPELSRVFGREEWQNNRQARHRCLFCSTKQQNCGIKRLARHAIACKSLEVENPELKQLIKTKFQELPFVSGSQQEMNNDRLNLQWIRILAHRNISFSFMDDLGLRKWLKENCPHFKPASRRLMASKYLPYESNSVSKQLSLLVENSSDFFLSVEFDHMTDTMSHRSILGIIATMTNGSRLLIALKDVTLFGKSSAEILRPLKESLNQYNSRKINSIISDSASSCKAAREKLLLESDFKHVIQHRCLAHLLNTIGESITKANCMKNMFEAATKLTSFINNHTKLSAMLKEAGHNRLVKSTPTRWYSHVNMLESLLEVRDEAKKLLEASNDEEQQNLLSELIFLTDLANAIRILRPLANCIAIAEKADGSVGEAIKAVLEFANSLFALNWGNELVTAAINSFLVYFSKAKLGDELFLMLACYFLDKKNKMNYITEYGIKMIFKTLAKVANKSGYSLSTISELLPNEFEAFCEQIGDYAKLPRGEENAVEWWSRMADVGILRLVGLRLANLKSSAANCERLFKDIKESQCPNRTNYSLDTLSDLMTIKLSVRQTPDDDDDLDDSVEESTSSSSQLTPRPSLSRRHPRNLSTRIHTHSEDSQRIENEFESSQASTLTVFSCGSQGRSEPQTFRLPSTEEIEAHSEFFRLIDFKIVRSFKVYQRTNIEELSDSEFESVMSKFDQVRSRTRSNNS